MWVSGLPDAGSLPPTFTPRTGCYSATLPGPLIRNGDPGCYKGCYKVLHEVLHFQNRAVFSGISVLGFIPVYRALTIILPVRSTPQGEVYEGGNLKAP